MARILIDFENVSIDPSVIKSIENDYEWDSKEECMMYRILINNPKRIDVDSFIPHYEFKYRTHELMEVSLQELRDKLEEEGIEFK